MNEMPLSLKVATVTVNRSERINGKNESECTYTAVVQVLSSATNQNLYEETINILEDGSLGHCLHMDLQHGISVACSATMKTDKSTLCVSLNLLGVSALHIIARGINLQVDLGKGAVPVDGVHIIAQSFSMTGGIAAPSATAASVNQLPLLEGKPLLVDHEATTRSDEVMPLDSCGVAAGIHASQQAQHGIASAGNSTNEQLEHSNASLTTTATENISIPEPMATWFVPPRDPQDEHAEMFYRASVSLVQTLVYMMGIGEQYGVHAPHPTMACVAPLSTCTYHPIHAYFKALFGEEPGRCFKCLQTASSYTHARRAGLSIRHLLSLCNACDTCGKAVCIRTFPRLRHERPKKGSKGESSLQSTIVAERSSSSAAKFLPVVPRLQELLYRLYCGANFKVDGPLTTVAQLFSFSPAFPRKLLLPDFTDKEFFQQAKKPCGGLSHLTKPTSAVKTEAVGGDENLTTKKRKVDDTDILDSSSSAQHDHRQGAGMRNDSTTLFRCSSTGSSSAAQSSHAQLSCPPSQQISDLTTVEHDERSVDPTQSLKDFLSKRFTDAELFAMTGASNAPSGIAAPEDALPLRKASARRKQSLAGKQVSDSQGAVAGPSSSKKAPVNTAVLPQQPDNSVDKKRGKRSHVEEQGRRSTGGGRGSAGSQSQEAEAQSVVSALLSLGTGEQTSAK